MGGKGSGGYRRPGPGKKAGRPTRTPGEPRVRLVVYVLRGTYERLAAEAEASGRPLPVVAADRLDASPPVATSPKCLHGEAENSGESWPPVAKPETS
jgi:hypothetical protein